ncbi:stage II sporulation protein M [Saliterribacillus persicus]|uniref:Stage II sporulation protein M n=1 Tax=Saliterribacillus persicus TaxID=930114 RepID=A0A368XAV6_9BACI|nr:stage II sporulation protein M [Saliterribacillus persicus]RCW64849.1 stage II sporulation protein M [Saliterribacillus persicus]
MYMQRKQRFINHIYHNQNTYVFMISLFITGIIFGAIVVNSMSFIQKQDLYFYLENFFHQFSTDMNLSKAILWKDSYFYHLQYIGLIFLLGLSVIGLPLIWVLIFIKGTVIGFSVGFFINQLGWKGFILSSVAIAPQNLLLIPIYLVAGTVAMSFSIQLLQNLFMRKNRLNIPIAFSKYFITSLILILFIGLATFIEVYLSYSTMRMTINNLLY